MTDLQNGRREGFAKAEAAFGLRALAILLQAGVLRGGHHQQWAVDKLTELLNELQNSNPSPKQPEEQADIDLVRKALSVAF